MTEAVIDGEPARGLVRTYYEALAGSRRVAATAIVLLVASGIAEALGIAALLPLLSSKLAQGAGGRHEWFGLTGDTLIFASVGALVVFGMLASLFRYLADSKSFVLWYAIEYTMRSRVVAALIDMRWSAYQRVAVGEGIKSVLVEGDRIGFGAYSFVQALGNAVIAATFVAAAAVIDPLMTAAVLVFGGLTAVMYRRVGHRSEALSRELSEQGTLIGEMTTDLLTNAKFYRSTGLAHRVRVDVDAHFATWAKKYARVRRFLPATRFAGESVGLVFIAAALVGTIVVSGNSVADALVFVALFYRLAPRLQTAQQSGLQARTEAAWWHTWKEQYDAAIEAADTPTGTVRLAQAPEIEFDAVSLTYPGRSIAALSDISYVLAPGECVAVVGESGSGKTSILDLVTGLLRPSTGAVRVGGTDLGDLDIEAWRAHIGLVMQENPVFHGTIFENITWTDEEPDESRARRAAEMAHLGEVIDALPDKLHSDVGQKGGRLSGGQRQRLALARALYRDPWLLILDEATSALDAESEDVIQDALRTLRGSCSMLIVAHRLKTVQMADRILVLAHGRVVEEGTWGELSERDGVFRKMLAAQLAGHPESELRERSRIA